MSDYNIIPIHEDKFMLRERLKDDYVNKTLKEIIIFNKKLRKALKFRFIKMIIYYL